MTYKSLLPLLAFAVLEICIAPDALATHGGSTTSQSSGSLFGSELRWKAQPGDMEVKAVDDQGQPVSVTSLPSGSYITIQQSTTDKHTASCTLQNSETLKDESLKDNDPPYSKTGPCTVDVQSTYFLVGACTKESGGVNASYIPLQQTCGHGADTTGSVVLDEGAFLNYVGDVLHLTIGIGGAEGLSNKQCNTVFPNMDTFAQRVMGQTKLYYAGDKACGGTATPVDQPIEQRVCSDVEGDPNNPTCDSQLNEGNPTGTAHADEFTGIVADANPNSINVTCNNEGDIWTFAAGSDELNVRDIDFATWRVQGVYPDSGVAPNLLGGVPGALQCEFGEFLGDTEHEDVRCRVASCPTLASLLQSADTDGDKNVDMYITFQTLGVATKNGQQGKGGFAGIVPVTLTP